MDELKLTSGARATVTIGERDKDGWIRASATEDGLSITVISEGERRVLHADDPRAMLRALTALVAELDRVRSLFHA